MSFEPELVGSRDRQFRGLLAGLPIIILLVILSTGAFATYLNQRCQDRFLSQVRVYPGAALVESQHEFLGLQRLVYATGAAPEQVEQWYSQAYAAMMRAAVISGDFSSLPSEDWLVEADGNGGSRVLLMTFCP